MLQPSIYEEICQTCGYLATRTLIVFYEGKTLRVPKALRRGTLLEAIAGWPATLALIEKHPGRSFRFPTGDDEGRRLRNYRDVAQLWASGASREDTAKKLGMTERRVSQLRAELRQAGVDRVPGQVKARSD